MLPLIKKELDFVVHFLLPAVIALNALWYFTHREFDFIFLAMIGFLAFLVLMALVNVNEQNEERYHGYSFLRTLPVSTIEVVGAKFAAVLLVDTILAASALAVFSFNTDDTPRVLALGRAYILGVGGIGLIAAALLYVGIFRLGYARFMQITVFAVLSLSVVFTMVVAKTIVANLDVSIGKIIDYVEKMNWGAAVVAILGLYALLLLLAVKAMDHQAKDAA